MVTITLTDEDIVRLNAIIMDADGKEAYEFVRGRLMPEVEKQQKMKMRSHLDGGKGSAF